MIGKIVSVNAGHARSVLWNTKEVTTGIFKEPVTGQVSVHSFGLDGDMQADLTVHGGPSKAVYAYPSEHYEYWREKLQNTLLSWGYFGENLTTQNLLENSVRVGDHFRIGSIEAIVTQPRFPCYKLGIKFGDMNMVKRFQTSGRSGFYMAIAKEGKVQEGDAIELINQNRSNPTIFEIFMAQADR